MENGFASPRTEAFPAGLRVLVVDDDAAWLKILEKMLKKCSYEVTTCFLAREALNMLRERKDGFDIVISDVNMPDMDGFKLLEHVGLEMDLPVIMMSVDGETSRVMKGVQHGACDYLLKPVRMKELKNIWQHVFRKKIHEVKDSESFEASEDSQVTRNGSEKFDDGNFLGGGDLNSVKKRKEMENKDHDDQDFNDPSAVKRARVVWSVDLHQKFVNAVDQIGLDKVGPKKILDLMNVPWLTRENVASHLQKYRMYLSRLQKQNDPKASFGGMKQPDFIPRDPPVSFGLQCSAIVHQENSTRCNFEYSGGKLMVQDVSSDFDEGDLKNIVSFSPRTEQRKALTGDLHQKRSSGSRMGHGHSLGSLGLDVNYTSFETTVPQHHSWNKEVPMMQFTQTPKREHEPHAHTHLPQSGPPIHIQSNCLGLTPSVPHGTCLTEKDTMSPSEAKILSTEYRSNHVRNVSPTGLAIGSFSARPETEILLKGFGPNTTITGSSSTKNQSVDQRGISTWEPACAETEILNLQGFGPNTTITRSSSTVTGSSSTINQSSDQKGVSTWESAPGKLLPGCGSTLQSPQEVLQLCALQDYDSIESTGLNNVEYLDYHDLELFTAFPGQSYDRLRLNCDYLGDSMDYPILDQGLFIA